jgi:ribonuclease BN (tRNA processing enzyme)
MRSLLLFTTLLVATAVAQDPRVILLGTGTPNPEPEHSGPAVAVVVGPNVYIVDSGPGVVRRAVQAGIRMDQLTRVFITHLHSDHTIGLPDLIFTPAVTGREPPLEIYGPPGLRAMTRHIMAAWSEDMQVRLHGLEPAVKDAYIVHAHEINPGEIYHDATVRVSAFAVAHGSWKHAYGYRFDAGGKVIVISGDTTFTENLIAAAKGCDILVHEFYSQKGWEARTPDWQRYHAAFHISAPDLGKLAARVQPKKLVLYHELPMGQPPDEVLGEIRQYFTGEVIYGKDLDVIR